MKVVGVGQINFWEGGSLWIGLSEAPVDPHSHHAIQVSIGLKGAIRFRTVAEGWVEYQGALVPPHLPHSFEATGSVTANIFCEPESETGRKLLARFGSETIVALPTDECQRLAATMREVYASNEPDPVLNQAARDVLQQLAAVVPRASATDARVAKAMAEIARRIHEPMALGEIADAVHISPSRLRHLFVAETGVPFRPYVLWLRLQHALEQAVAGASWTEAAHASSFADSAHLSRTFRRMFGLNPSALPRLQPADGRSALTPGS